MRFKIKASGEKSVGRSRNQKYILRLDKRFNGSHVKLSYAVSIYKIARVKFPFLRRKNANFSQIRIDRRVIKYIPLLSEALDFFCG